MSLLVPLKRVAQIRYGLGQPPPLSDDGVPILRATNIARGKISEKDLLRARIEDLPLDRAPLLREGEILVVRSGAYTGDSARITGEWSGSAPGYDLRVSPYGIDSHYLAYALLSTSVQDQINLASSRAAQPHLNAEELGGVSLWTPPLDEQHRIATFLDAEVSRIDRLIGARRRQYESLDERAYAAMSDMLIPGTLSMPSQDWPWAWLPRLPEHLPLVRLGYVCRLQSGITVDSKRDAGGDPVTRPYLRVANVQADRVELDSVTEITVPRDVAARSTLRSGDVLMTEGGDLDKLGRGTVWNGEIAECLHQNHVFALRPDRDRLDGGYLALLTQSLHGRCYFESTGVKTTNLASTNSSKILDFPLPLPSVQRQKSLVRQVRGNLDAVARAKHSLERQLDLLAERRQALITAAVTGQLDVASAGRTSPPDGI